ncbi:MAG TPA: hypothetical protein VIY86_03220 [Pirellulaceae bacterium]
MKTTSIVVAWVALAVFASLVPLTPILAGTLNLNDLYNAGNPFAGSDVEFASLIETNGQAVATNYFRTPTVSGNILTLLPENFRVDVNPGPGDVSVGSRLAMEIQADPGKSISQFVVQQVIAYSLRGGRTNDATGTATISFAWEVLAGASLGTTGSTNQNHTKSASPNSDGTWTSTYAVDLATLAPGATRVRLEFDDQFRGQATRSGIAYVTALQQPGVTVSVNVVPEPIGGLLVVAGAIFLLAARRRRK